MSTIKKSYMTKNIYLTADAVDAIDRIMEMTDEKLSKVVQISVQHYVKYLQEKADKGE